MSVSRLSFLTLSIAWVSLFGQYEQPWSLQRCVEYARENNLNITQARLQSRINLNDKQAAAWNYAPSVNASANYGINYGLNIDPVTNIISQQTRRTSNFQLTANWVLLDGGRKFKSINQASSNYQASIYEYEAAVNDISLNIANAYLQILLNKEIENVAREQVAISRLQRDQMDKRVQAGNNPEGDLLQLEAQLARDQQSLIAAENNVTISKLQLANLLQLEDPADFDVAPPVSEVPEPTVISLNPSGIYETAVEQQPVIKGAEYRVESSDHAVGLSRAGYFPRVSFVAQVGSNYSDQIPNVTDVQTSVVPIGEVASSGELVTSLVPQSIPIVDGTKPFTTQFEDNLNQFIGFNLTIPIFNQMAVSNDVQNAKIREDIAKLDLQREKLELRQNIFQAHADAKASYKEYVAAQKSVAASEKAFDYAEERFKVGAMNQLDFETAKNNLLSARSQMIQAKYDYLFRIKVLDFYLTNQVL